MAKRTPTPKPSLGLTEGHYRVIADSAPDALVSIDEEGMIVFANPAAEELLGYSATEMIGRPVTMLIPEELREAHCSAFTRYVATGERRRSWRQVSLPCAHASGKQIHLNLSFGESTNEGRHIFTLAAHRIAGPGAAESRARRQSAVLKALNQELETLNQVHRAVNRSIELDALLTNVLKTVTRLEELNIEPKGIIFLLEGDTLKLRARIGDMAPFLKAHQTTLALGQCLCGLAAAKGEMLVSTGCSDRRHTLRCPDTPDHGHVVVPLKANGAVMGVLTLYLPHGLQPSESTLNTLQAAGKQIAIAVRNAQTYERARALSVHDPLTGLANRRLMQVFMHTHFAQARRTNASFSVLMVDIDHFKAYNDKYGHSAGDAVLVDIAGVVSNAIREADLVVRYGGEEFLVLLADTPIERAYAVAERIRDGAARETPVTVSVGVAGYDHAAATQKDLVDAADRALYLAKSRGRNRIEVATTSAAGQSGARDV